MSCTDLSPPGKQNLSNINSGCIISKILQGDYETTDSSQKLSFHRAYIWKFWTLRESPKCWSDGAFHGIPYIYIYNPPIGANHGSCICFHSTNRAICGCKKAGLFPVWWLNLLRNLATKCDQSHLFCLGNSAKLGVKALSKLRRWRRKWQGFFGVFRFQSWWHYTFEERISLTWSNDSGFSGWSAQLFACSFLLCEMSTSKPFIRYFPEDTFWQISSL